MNFFIIFICILACFSELQAKVTELSLDIKQIKEMRHAYYPGKTDWYSYVGLNWDVSAFPILGMDRLIWENTTFFYGDRSQVRHIGWHSTLGLPINNAVMIYYHHKSEHDADHGQNDPQFPDRARFPLENSIGVRINLLQ